KVSAGLDRGEIADDWIPGIKPGMTDELVDPGVIQSRCAVRLGLRLVGGLPEKATKQTVLKARGRGYADMASAWVRSGAPVGILERLADADVFRSMGLD